MKLRLGLTSAALCAAAAVIVSSGCTTVPGADRYVAPPLGSTWTASRRDAGSYGSTNVQTAGKRGERMWQGKQVIAFESTEATTLAYPDGSWIAQVRGDTPLVSWDPPLTYDWPLEVGKTWTRKHKLTVHATKQTIPFESTQKVEAYEDVTVPAGTFKAFKMVTSDSLGNENVNWFSPELGIFVKSSLRRTAKHQAGPGTRESEIVSHTIRR